MIYTVSNFQNPTGITMTLPRRKELVRLATEYNIPIIDDNPYGDIRFEGERVATLKSIGGDNVIALRTFSKIISPGMRIGWMNGPEDVLKIFEIFIANFHFKNLFSKNLLNYLYGINSYILLQCT